MLLPLRSTRPIRASRPLITTARPLTPLSLTRIHNLPAFLHLQRRTASSTTNPTEPKDEAPRKPTLALPTKGRVNEIGVQQVSSVMYDQLFKVSSAPPPDELVALSRDHLQRHELLGKVSDTSKPIAFNLPELRGKSLDEHFHRLGMEASQPYLDQARTFSRSDLPRQPRNFEVVNEKTGKKEFRSGWTRYGKDGTVTHGVLPGEEEEMLVFDVEVLYKHNPFAVMACAASPNAWYAWISPWLLGETENPRQLVPIGSSKKPKIIIGHNVGYDRARIKDEYTIEPTANFFMDTMSLHVAVNGMCSQQRPTWLKHAKNRALRDEVSRETESIELANMLQHNAISEEEEELWVGRSSINSLRDVAKFHCDISIDKSIRDQFGELDRQGVVDKLGELLDYCAADVAITHKVFKVILPRFLETCPHPVSFGALRHISSVMLPTSKEWEEYVATAESKYQEFSNGVGERLHDLAKEALKFKDQPEKFTKDPWLKQLDWSGMEIKMTKGTKKAPPREIKNQKMPGMPKWYKDLYPKKDGPISLTVRQRAAPVLLKLTWDGNPLIWSDKHGWCFRIDKGPGEEKYKESSVVQVSMQDESNYTLRDDISGIFYKLPHANGPASRVVNPMAKSYLQYFETGQLGSEFPLAKEALEMNAACSYWISARTRIKSQIVVYQSDIDSDMGVRPADPNALPPLADPSNPPPPSNHEIGMILPQIIPMGTITRRAVEATWLTASNAKKNRVGSELKAMIQAPPGYSLVGADVDSEELWIASLVGDAQFKLHGGNAIGFMTLEGAKAQGTDLHSRTASILGISRNHAKIFNYGRIYGAGLKFAATLLRQFNPGMTDAKALEIANNLYRETKGIKTDRRALFPRPFWRGGTESFVFNTLETFADQDRPRTPVLGAGITEALLKRYISRNAYLTSRINWAIQSSGVDYLHLLIISMDYLIRMYSISARLSITVHDEIRYLVRNEDAHRCAMALQVANIWTRAMFCQQMGINDLPQSCAFFSAVDIDSVLRKEVNVDCITPSHPNPIPHGRCLDLPQLLEQMDAELRPSDAKPIPVDHIPYEPRTPVMEGFAAMDPLFLRAQITADDKELSAIVRQAEQKAKQGQALMKSEAAKIADGGVLKRRAYTGGKGRRVKVGEEEEAGDEAEEREREKRWRGEVEGVRLVGVYEEVLERRRREREEERATRAKARSRKA